MSIAPEFMAFVNRQQSAMDGLLGEIEGRIRAGDSPELIYAHLTRTMAFDRDRASMVAVMAVYRLAEKALEPPKSCTRHEFYRCEIEDL